jgi:uncharacterized protein YdhG (YjbR/CyaY superfamily)
MPTASGDRKQFFPAIEKKYGQPMRFWFDIMDELKDEKYPAQVAYLIENHGFSQTHANAVVMYSRGSTSSKRFADPKDYFAKFDATSVKTAKKIVKAIQEKYPSLEFVTAWNQPMLRTKDGDYVFGLSILKNHILLGPWSKDATKVFADRLTEYKVLKKTIQVPSDWKVDVKLIQDLAKARMAEIKKK